MFIKRLIFICLSLFACRSMGAFADSFSVQTFDVQVCFINSSTVCGFVPPSLLIGGGIDKITITMTGVDIAVDSGKYYDDKWGLQFANTTASPAYICTQTSCPGNGMAILVNPQTQVVTPNDGSQGGQDHIVGTLIYTLSDFPNGKLPLQLQDLITNASTGGSIIVSATYSTDTPATPPPNGGGTPPATQNPRTSNPYTWGPDVGAILNPPTLSVFARFQGFAVNIQPPTDTLSVVPNPLPDDGTSSPPLGGTSNAITLISGENPGRVSGYLIAYWLARDLDFTQPCSTQWAFGPNPISYNSSHPTPTLTCVYPPYIDAFGIGGTDPSFGCVPGPVPIFPPYLQPPFDTKIPTLTEDIVAVPGLFSTFPSKLTNMANLIAHPGSAFEVPGTCLNVAFIPNTQSSFTHMGIQNGQVYGVTAWTLNYAFSQTTSSSEEAVSLSNFVWDPNLSLLHSNVAYITGVDASLASTAKTPSLPMVKSDCFVATAASGDINSNSVFYWRALRDAYLTDWGFTKFYLKHGPKWAEWLNEHPKYKPPVNFVLEKTGAFFYFSALYSKKAAAWTSEHTKPVVDWTVEHTKKFVKFISNLWEDEVYATETWAPENEYVGPKLIQFDFALAAGVLFPTSDKKFYNKYYNGVPVDLELSSSMLFWTSNFGWSVGLKGIYLFANHSSEIPVLGDATQSENLALNGLGLEVIGGVRYRNPNFLFLQPGIYAGAGVWRLREEATAKGDSGENSSDNTNQTLGVTKYSPVFDFGANLDVSLATIFMYSQRELALERDILLRLSAIYRLNPTNALSASGFVLTGGFAFLF